MRTSSLVVATFVAAASLAGAVPDRPKIYFPREIKRQITNSTSARTTSEGGSTRRASGDGNGIGIDSTNFLPSFLGGTGTGSGSGSETSSTTASETEIVLTSTVYVSPTATDSADSTTTTDSTDATTTDSTTDSETASSTTSDAVIAISIPTLLPIGGDTTTASSSNATTTTDISSSTPTVTDTDTDSTTATSSGITLLPTVTTSSTDGLLPGLSSILSGILDPTNTTDTIATATSTDSTSASATSASDSLLPTLSAVLSSILDPTSTTYSGTGASSTSLLPTVTSSGTAVVNGTDSTSSLPTITSSIPISTPPTSVVNGTSTDPISVPVSSTDVTNSTTPATVEPTSSLPTATVSVPVNTTATSTDSISSASITETPTYTSVLATGTITNSESWLPSTIIVQPSSSQASGSTTTTTTGIPTSLPKAITPNTSPAAQPDGTTAIQISFLYGLNYNWIVSQPLAAAQMFALLPQAVAYKRGFNSSDVVMQSIVPYDTTAQLGYITSQAIMYIPSDALTQLRLDHNIASSPLYTNPDSLVVNMTNQINPAIDIIMGSTLAGSGTTSSDGSDATSTSTSNNNDVFGTSDSASNQTSSQKGTTVAIAFGSAAVAGAYGAAMFVIARRYKRRKQRHQRSSSITSPSEMRQAGSPAMMGGALLSRDFTAAGYGGVGGNTRDSQGSGRSGMNNSGRTAFISAPVAAENSLGWN
ncbi:hypothetical protein BX600DRAFT_429493 [Xylariales sp. PMI_506]|nr:hypothetical protein BX600DRAFT_429493 [Xylariales sp. PMI_506]